MSRMDSLDLAIIRAAEAWARSVNRREQLEDYERELYEAVTARRRKILKKDWDVPSAHHKLPSPPKLPKDFTFTDDEVDTERYSEVPTKPSPAGLRIDLGPDEED